jgi:hypothetical protein
MGPLGTKICSKCKKSKELEAFYSYKTSLDGKRGFCKKCHSEYNRRCYLEEKGLIPKDPVQEEKKRNRAAGLRKCIKCGEVKKLERFYAHKTSPDGKESTCKECCSKRQKEDRQRPEVKSRIREGRQKPEIKIRHKEYQQSPAGKAQSREYSQRPKIKAREGNRRKERCAKDLSFKLAKNLRTRVGQAVKGGCKGGSSVKKLGCPISDFIGYIGNKFWPGMVWKDWGKGPGKWNLDHIIPLSVFDLTDPEQYCLAAHYTNYQPLWFEDNSKKNDFIPTVLVQPVPFCGMMLAVALDENNQAVVKCFV